ncbi:AmmeMemoRadiSam system protein A [Sporanaerobacter sp. PP17-6a]|uniref:AmmeMemoRadiSam system protein A n=1 Tax=Sporanaerobacter sp. PP17-6a TaxID=1891289 RepID=UPI0008A02E8C|nr:AmmeMemoRadiSam system protein A [Sporanaerobacter sp. PP17-6a]SCL86751.1 3,4-dihydroxyphenylacetate 2,3-dioxygenase [Sporanaerobacter sp. PP17-6a]
MGRILGFYLFPHPPVVIEEIGGEERLKAQQTITGVEKLSEDIEKKKPQTIIIITPHGPMFSNAVSISTEKNLKGDLKKFGNNNLEFNFENNLDLVDKIVGKAQKEGIPTAKIDERFGSLYNVDPNIDHGTLIPLYFVNKKYSDYKLVHITYGLISPLKLYKFGILIKEAVLESNEDIVFIASGDLSHRLSDEGPYNYAPEGKIFDREIVEFLKEGNFEDIASYDLNFGEKAGECALRSLIVLSGFLDGLKLKTEVVSYEGPFGVGYCTMKGSVEGEKGEGSTYEKILKKQQDRIEDIRAKEDSYVKLARQSLEYYVSTGETMKIPKDLSKELLNERAGVFVTIKKDNLLRGCIGTIDPEESSIAGEIIRNAVSAGTKDPRFNPVRKDELKDIVYSVDVLGKAEIIKSIDELDIKEYGVIVSKGFKMGLLLPDIEGVDTPEDQVSIAMQKAGIKDIKGCTLERFQVVRHF